MDQALKLFPDSEDLHWAALWMRLHSIKRMRPNATLPGPEQARRIPLSRTFRRGPCKAKANCDSDELTQQAMELERSQKLTEIELSDWDSSP